jgi:hypothetical protein
MRGYSIFALPLFLASTNLGHGGGLDVSRCHDDRKQGDEISN